MIKKLTGALSLSLLASTAMAGGVERSNQSVAPLFADGNYIELSFGTVRPNVTGSVGAAQSGDMGGDYTQVGLALKMDVTDNIAVALIQDQPYGANVSYPTGTGYPFAGTNAEIKSRALTAIAKYQVNENFSAYAGVRRHSLEADVSIPAVAGYTLDMSKGSGTGYLAGVAYEIPEIALRVSLTYNSAIESTHTYTEAGPGAAVTSETIKAPKSWHLEAQSGIAENTLMFGSIRHVNWSAFSATPPVYQGATTTSLLSYSNDVTTYSLGVGRRLNENWSVSASASYEKAQGGTATNLAPTDGRRGLTLGARYEQDGMSISAGLNYTWLGDAQTVINPVGPVLSSFTDNYVVGAGVRIGYSF